MQSDDAVTRVIAGRPVTPAADGWMMSDALYLRYRRAVADRIAEIQSMPVKP